MKGPVRIAVLGLGNVLRRDDGVGPAVVARLEAGYDVPADVEVLDLGTPGLDLVDQLVHRDAIVFVDAIVHAGAPGSVHLLTPAALRGSTGRVAPSPRMTSHEAGVDDALVLAAMDGRGPRHVRMVGDRRGGPRRRPRLLRAPSRASAPGGLRGGARRMAVLGFEATPRAVPRPDAAWWRTFATEVIAAALPA